jgi:hypothetical protein
MVPVAGAVRPRCPPGRIRLPAGLVATVDSGRIRQAVDNLVDNALRFAPRGTESMLSANRVGPLLVIEVRDREPGRVVATPATVTVRSDRLVLDSGLHAAHAVEPADVILAREQSHDDCGSQCCQCDPLHCLASLLIRADLMLR